MVKSQRTAFSALILACFLVIGAFAYTSGHPLIIQGDNLDSKLASVVSPFLLILGLMRAFMGVINSRVESGSLKPGDILGLTGLSEFWVTFVAIVSGLLQMFGFEVLSADTQVLLVNLGMGLVAVLVSSLSERAPLAVP